MSNGTHLRVTTLDNGLRVATDTMNGVETVSLGVWVGVGTRHEDAAVNGVAHLVEHMLFKGTGRRSAYAISAEIEDVGGHLNAYTTREQTAYYAKVLHEDTALAVDLIADMLQYARLDEEDLVRERAVVLQEIGQSFDTPDDIIFDHFQSAAFPGQAIGRPVLGEADIVAALPRAALTNYLQSHYHGASMVLTAAGRIEHDALVELAQRYFAHLPSGTLASRTPARYQGGDFRADQDLEQVHLVLGFNGLSMHDPDFYASSVFSTLLGGGMSSRLFQEVREKRGLAYSIHTFSAAYQDGGLFGIYAGTGADQVAELIPVLCEEINLVAATLHEDEVLRARAQLKAGTLMALESSMSRCEQLGQQMLAFGRPIPTAEVVARIDAIDSATVRRVAGRIARSRPTLAALGPLDGLESYAQIAGRLEHSNT